MQFPVVLASISGDDIKGFRCRTVSISPVLNEMCSVHKELPLRTRITDRPSVGSVSGTTDMISMSCIRGVTYF
jgi:hypothetical protein